MLKDHIQRGSICWLHFHNMAQPGHGDCGEYAYIQSYVKDHSKKVEDGEIYVKVAIKDIFWLSGKCRFVFEIMCTDGSLLYQRTVDGADRLTPFDWKWPSKLEWSVTQNY